MNDSDWACWQLSVSTLDAKLILANIDREHCSALNVNSEMIKT